MEKEKCEDTIDLRSGDTVTYNKIITLYKEFKEKIS